MKLSEFDYNLPKELIAQTPIEPRDHSRLLILDSQKEQIQEAKFFDIINQLGENDVLVLNKTKVINARLKGKNESGRTVEVFLHKQLGEKIWDCLIFPGKKLKPGRKIEFYLDSPSFTNEKRLENKVLTAKIKEISKTGRIIEFNKGGLEFLKIIQEIGEIPLPPYIKEKLNSPDRYQTIWAEKEGSAAAPTASLHFTPELLEKLKNKGVKTEKVLLHVGLGTFMPMYTNNIEEHKMHGEYIELKQDVAKRLNQYKKEGKRIIAVGTTAIRVLESMSDEYGIIHSGSKETEIFIYPGYKWKFVDAIITNFHLPKSTLLMLVSSFAGINFIKKVYSYAINKKFRFFSFGDVMFIKNKKIINGVQKNLL